MRRRTSCLALGSLIAISALAVPVLGGDIGDRIDRRLDRWGY